MRRDRVTYVMEDRPIFKYLTMEGEHAGSGCLLPGDTRVKDDIDEIYVTVPRLRR